MPYLKNKQQNVIKNLIISLNLIQGLFIFAVSINLYVKDKGLDKFLNFTVLPVETIVLLLIIISFIVLGTSIFLVYDLSKASENKLEQSNINLRKQRHEFINHLESLSYFLNNNQIEEAQNYLDRIGISITTQSQLSKLNNSSFASVINSFMHKCESRGLFFEFNCNTSLENLKISPEHIIIIFSNLLTNAAENCTEGGIVTFEIIEYINKFRFIITNTGQAIDPSLDVFEEGVSTKGENRGYGLPNVKEILDKYNGDIYIEDYYPPTFVVVINKEGYYESGLD